VNKEKQAMTKENKKADKERKVSAR